MEHFDMKMADVGYLVTSDDVTKQGFYIDNDQKVVKLKTRACWMYIEEKGFFVPDLPDDKLGPTVLDFLDRLRSFDNKFKCLSY